MNLNMKWEIVVHAKEKAAEGKANHYYLTEEGFHIYPIGVPINIYTHGNAKPAGTAIVKEVVLRENKTIALYELVALSSVN